MSVDEPLRKGTTLVRAAVLQRKNRIVARAKDRDIPDTALDFARAAPWDLFQLSDTHPDRIIRLHL